MTSICYMNWPKPCLDKDRRFSILLLLFFLWVSYLSIILGIMYSPQNCTFLPQAKGVPVMPFILVRFLGCYKIMYHLISRFCFRELIMILYL